VQAFESVFSDAQTEEQAGRMPSYQQRVKALLYSKD
jgi:hypothetical protein